MTAMGTAEIVTTLHGLIPLQECLLEMARAWVRGIDIDPAATATRHAALRLCHEHYRALVPAYRHLAEPLGTVGPVEVTGLVDNLLFSGLFKSYDLERLQDCD